MTLYIAETGEEKTLKMCVLDGDQWGVDFFRDAECNVDDGSTVTLEEYQEIVDFWEDEVNCHNDGEDTEQFGDYNGTVIGFFYD